MALPEFQRPFVWEPSDVLDLLDSVSNGWPIGSLLTLEGPQPFRTMPIESGPHVESRGVRSFLLDGQQRVTALYHVLTQSGDVIYYVDLAEGSADDPPDFKWARKASGIPPSASPWAFPVALLMDERAFSKHISTAPRVEAVHLDGVRRSRIGSLLDSEYRVPAIVMAQDIELEALTKIFENLNRSGVHLDAFDLMVAVLYPFAFKLRDEWESAKRRLRLVDDFGVHGLEILKVVALWRRDLDRQDPPARISRRVSGVRQRDVLNTPSEFIVANWERALDAYERSLRFLYDFGGVRNGNSIPSTAMALAAAYMIDDGADFTLLRRWYWQCILDQRYAQGANTQVTADVDAYRHGELLRSNEHVFGLVRAAMGDQVRRNRILRLGLRGLAVKNQLPDPVDEVRMGGPVVDVPLRSLIRGTLRYDASTPVTEMVTLDEGSLRFLRRNASGGEVLGLLSEKAMAAQGFPLDIRSASEAEVEDLMLSRRLDFVLTMVGKELG